MEGSTPQPTNTTLPEISPEWLYENYKQQQLINAAILQTLEDLRKSVAQ